MDKIETEVNKFFILSKETTIYEIKEFFSSYFLIKEAQKLETIVDVSLKIVKGKK